MDNKDFNQTTPENTGTSEGPASDTLDTLNKLNEANVNPNLNAHNVLSIIGGILFFITALAHVVNSIQYLIAFFQWGGGWYATFANTFFYIITSIDYLAAAAGFGFTGAALIIKNYNLKMQFMKVSSLLMIGFCMGSILCTLIHSFRWYGLSNAFEILFYIFYGLLWAAIAMLAFQIKPELTKKMSLIYIIVPSVMLALRILFGLSSFIYMFGNILLVIIEFAALIITGVIIYMNLNTDITGAAHIQNHHAENTTTGTSSGTAAGNSAEGSAAYYSIAADPEGYTGIVKLILLSIVTFGIYVYIWIYRTAKFIVKRTPVALQSSPGVQVVLCLFVPFYMIYWVYKQCRAVEDYKMRTTGAGGDDLAIICLLLCIFGFGIIAYALLQDQINKIVKPSPEYSYAPENPGNSAEHTNNVTNEPTAASITDAQIKTVEKLKELLDAGILTQEEFDAKKKQVLDL